MKMARMAKTEVSLFFDAIFGGEKREVIEGGIVVLVFFIGIEV